MMVNRYENVLQPHITGKVITYDGQEHVAGIKVTLRGLENRCAMETMTDSLGRFEFDGVRAGITYIIKAQSPGLITAELTLKLNNSLDLGNLVLHQS